MNNKVKAILPAAITSLGAFILYGGWAVYANWEHGQATALTSGIAQGTASFCITLFLSLLVDLMLSVNTVLPARLFLAIVVPNTVTPITMYTIHWLINTPNIVKTILPSFLVGIAYSIVYSIGRLNGGRPAANSAH